jgi:hypothetical protein
MAAMSKLVQVPKSALEALLREAGHVESVEAYLASPEVQTAIETGSKLIKRARAAYWSRFWLLFSAAVTWVGCSVGPDLEGFVSGLLLTGMTIVEFKVYTLFLAADVRGAIYGWWNQCLFAFLFLVYGGYHGTFVSVPTELQGMLDTESLSTVVPLERIFYYLIGVVGAGGQFWLACYYRAAGK